MLPDPIRDAVERVAGAVRSVQPVGGGDVSRAARVGTASGPVFAKWGTGPASRTYASEADGLALLRATADQADADLAVPQPPAVVPETDGLAGLVLPWIEPARPSESDWRRGGAGLAALHRVDAGADYGLDADNWIGSKPQRNGWLGSWPGFFGERRLLAQAETVRQSGAWDAAWDAPLARLVARLPELLPETPPRSVVHGDLWAGNAMGTPGGAVALIDPAAYVGHREADLAMTELFGGFPPAFYDGYRQSWPLEPGYPERREVYNLYHLVNHLTHGASYRRPVQATLRKFGT